MRNEDKAQQLAEQLAEAEDPEDTRAAAVTYALLAVADRLLDLAVEVEKAGWAKE